MKKKLGLFLFLSFAIVSNVMANGATLLLKSEKERKEREKKQAEELANKPQILFPLPWFIVENSNTITFDKKNFLLCESGRKKVSNDNYKSYEIHCDSGEKILTPDELVKTKFTNGKLVALTPTFEKDGGFKFAVVYYLIEDENK